jgi:hypothetical protein
LLIRQADKFKRTGQWTVDSGFSATLILLRVNGCRSLRYGVYASRGQWCDTGPTGRK